MRSSKYPLLILPFLMLALTTLACLGAPGPAPTAVPTAVSLPTDVPATAEPTPLVEPTVEVTAAVTSSDAAKDELVRAIQAVATAGPYHVVSSLASGATNVSEHGDVILPDKFHLFATLNGLAEREYLIIGSNTYIGVNGQLTQTQADISSLIQGFINTFDPDKISNVIDVGTEDLSGTSAKHFTFTYTNTISGTEILSTVNMWVGVDNGLPIKQVIDGTANGNPYHAEQTITYDPSITIEAP